MVPIMPIMCPRRMRKAPDRRRRLHRDLLLLLRCSPVFVETAVQGMAVVIDTLTEMLAGASAAPVLAPVGALGLFVARSDRVQETIDRDYRNDRRENESEEPDWKLAGHGGDVMIF